MFDVKIKQISLCRKRLLGVSFLCLLLICTCFLQVVAGTEPTVVKTAQDQLTYADPSGEPIPLSQGDVVSGLLGGISQDEMAYLNAHSAYCLYISDVPQDYITAHSYDGGVRVVARAYTYTTAQGVDVTWTPAFAWAEGDTQMVTLTYEKASDGYTGQLSGADVASVEVTYATTLTLPLALSLTMVNEAPTAAQKLMTDRQAYEDLLSAWEKDRAAYAVYLADYDAWKVKDDAHKDYLTALSAYETWWDDYDTKQAAIDAYNKQMTAYETWEQYEKDLAAYEAYMELVAASPELKAAYEQAVNTAQEHISLMDRMFIVSDISGYSFEGVLNSGAADYVINNKNLILNMDGVNEADVRNAISATYDLRDLVAEYRVLTTNEDKYAYYIANREVMVTQMNLLYDSMVALGEVKDVMAEVEERGGRDAFVQFLGNLYVQSRLLDDTQTLDKSLVLFAQPLTSLMESDLIYTDTNQTAPVGETYPQPPVTVDDVPAAAYPGDPPPETAKPQEVAPLPDINTAPARPTVVAEPGEPPQAVADPGSQPAAPQETSQETALRLLAIQGEMTERVAEDLATDGQLSISRDIGAQVLRGKKYQVTVMDETGEIYEVLYVPFGESAEERLTPPQVTGKNGSPLVFVGWSRTYVPLPETQGTPEAELVNVSFVNGSMTLYPVYAMASAETDTPMPDRQDTAQAETTMTSPPETSQEALEAQTQESASAPQETETQPQNTVSQVPWYARIMGAIGLKGLVVIAGVVLGGLVAGSVILVVKLKDKKKKQ